MRKLSYLLCIMMLISLISCGSKEEKKEAETKTEASQTEGAKKYNIALEDGNYYTGIMALPLVDGYLEGALQHILKLLAGMAVR